MQCESWYNTWRTCLTQLLSKTNAVGNRGRMVYITLLDLMWFAYEYSRKITRTIAWIPSRYHTHISSHSIRRHYVIMAKISPIHIGIFGPLLVITRLISYMMCFALDAGQNRWTFDVLKPPMWLISSKNADPKWEGRALLCAGSRRLRSSWNSRIWSHYDLKILHLQHIDIEKHAKT